MYGVHSVHDQVDFDFSNPEVLRAFVDYHPAISGPTASEYFAWTRLLSFGKKSVAEA